MKNSLIVFSQKNPTFFYGLFFFLGLLFTLASFWAFFFALFFLVFVEKKHVFFLTITFLSAIVYLSKVYYFPSSNEEIKGVFHIHYLRQNTKFSDTWMYLGYVKTREGRFPCKIQTKQRYLADKDYEVSGFVNTRDGRIFTLKEKESFKRIEKSFSLAEKRFQAKEWTSLYIQKKFPNKKVADFLSGIATGKLEDLFLMKEFNVLGLSHLLAISGFHFALLAFIFHFLLRFFLPQKIELILLLILLTGYLLFIGPSPSCFRAWIFATIYLFSGLLEKKAQAINSLGIAALLSLFFNPMEAFSLSFQLSFLATTGILFFFQPFEKALFFWIPKLKLIHAIQKPFIAQLAYLGASFFRNALALNLAVHVALIPLLFFQFHCFSLNSMVYNLFFPFLASFSILFFILGCLFGDWIHLLNGMYTETILKLTDEPPMLFKTFYVKELPLSFLTFYLASLLLLGIYLNSMRDLQRKSFFL